MTTVASAVLFRSESKGSGFHANVRTSLINCMRQFHLGALCVGIYIWAQSD